MMLEKQYIKEWPMLLFIDEECQKLEISLKAYHNHIFSANPKLLPTQSTNADMKLSVGI